jgi:hypothetical protein
MHIMPDISRLETLITESAPSHYGCERALETENEIVLWANNNSAMRKPINKWFMPVSNQFCQDTIYSEPAINMAFRAWHDSLHLQHNVGFDLVGELEVARLHQIAGVKAGLSDVLLQVLWLDTAGQNLYEVEHGMFPRDQKAFISYALSVSLKAAIKRGGF